MSAQPCMYNVSELMRACSRTHAPCTYARTRTHTHELVVCACVKEMTRGNRQEPFFFPRHPTHEPKDWQQTLRCARDARHNFVCAMEYKIVRACSHAHAPPTIHTHIHTYTHTPFQGTKMLIPRESRVNFFLHEKYHGFLFILFYFSFF